MKPDIDKLRSKSDEVMLWGNCAVPGIVPGPLYVGSSELSSGWIEELDDCHMSHVTSHHCHISHPTISAVVEAQGQS